MSEQDDVEFENATWTPHEQGSVAQALEKRDRWRNGAFCSQVRMNRRLQDLKDSTAFFGFVALFHVMPSTPKVLATLGRFTWFDSGGSGETEA